MSESIESRPELFDAYDGKSRTSEQQSEFDAYHKDLIASAPDYIKQAIATCDKSKQPA